VPHLCPLGEEGEACGRRSRRRSGFRQAQGVPGPRPLPDALLKAPFTPAQAREHGVTTDMLRGRRLQAPFYGVRVAAGSADSLIGRCAALAARYPDAAFSHRTAASLHELPLPTDALRAGSAKHATHAVDANAGRSAREIRLTLDVMVPAGRRAPRARDLNGHTGLRPGDTQMLSCGLRVVRPPLIWSQLAAALDLIDLVVLGDACLGSGLATTTQLQAMADLERHGRGVRPCAARCRSSTLGPSRPWSRTCAC